MKCKCTLCTCTFSRGSHDQVQFTSMKSSIYKLNHGKLRLNEQSLIKYVVFKGYLFILPSIDIRKTIESLPNIWPGRTECFLTHSFQSQQSKSQLERISDVLCFRFHYFFHNCLTFRYAQKTEPDLCLSLLDFTELLLRLVSELGKDSVTNTESQVE